LSPVRRVVLRWRRLWLKRVHGSSPKRTASHSSA